jgi:anti-sigma regulatory factor (Ser/Thr protein kinase)
MGSDRSAAAPRFLLCLPSAPASVPIARRFAHVLDAWTDPARIDQVELIVSELVTNAVRHGSHSTTQSVELQMSADSSGIAGSVSDEGRGCFTLSNAPPKPDQPGGLGLFIARALADTLDVECSATGSTVRFTVASPEGP